MAGSFFYIFLKMSEIFNIVYKYRLLFYIASEKNRKFLYRVCVILKAQNIFVGAYG